MTPTHVSHLNFSLAAKPDFARCMERIEAWFEQEIVDRPPLRFYPHNVEYEGGTTLDTTRWASLEERWFDAEYQVETFERSLTGRVFHAETFPVFWSNLGPNVYSAFYGGRLQFAEVTSWLSTNGPKRLRPWGGLVILRSRYEIARLLASVVASVGT